MAIYDQIGQTYDSTRMADPEIVAKILSRLQPEQGRKYLDLACGTGNYTIAYKNAGAFMVGVDQSALMIECARNRDALIEWYTGNAECLPFKDAAFHGITCTNAIHHFSDLKKVTRECARVMNSGRIVIFCSTQDQMERYWLNLYFPEMMKKSIEQMPTQGHILECLDASGFKELEIAPFFVTSKLRDLFLYSAKQRPEFYLSENFRRNISSFASLADEREVKCGLSQLRVDIDNGKIAGIIRESESPLGDYLIVSGRISR